MIADIVKAEGAEVVAFLDDNPSQSDCSGPMSDYAKFADCEFIIGIGSFAAREKFSALNLKWHTAIHPSAVVSDSAKIGEGTVVMPNAVVNARTVIGRHCIVNSGAIVEHDNAVEDYAHIAVGAKLGGTVRVGKGAWIGIGAVVKNNVNVCGGCIVGAGAVVVKDIDEEGTYIGVPAVKI